MKIKRSIWPMALAGAFLGLLADLGFHGGSVAEARGGGGGGRGGGRGGSRGGTRGGLGGGAGRNARQNEKQREEQQRQRREELRARIEKARIDYAKRERQALWDAEAASRVRAELDRTLGGATE
jgi:hypothetical protein